jgi:hypothetical protein
MNSADGQAYKAARGGEHVPFEMPATAREIVLNRYTRASHGVEISGRLNPHGPKHTSARIMLPAGRLSWERGVDNHREYTYWQNAFHSERARLGDGNQNLDGMNNRINYRQCNQYECAWETRTKYLAGLNNEPKAMFRIFRDEYLSSDRTTEVRTVNDTVEVYSEFAGPGRCECAVLGVTYDVPYYDYPSHSERKYKFTQRHDAGFPIVEPDAMNGNPAGGYNVWRATSARGAGLVWQEVVHYYGGRWYIFEDVIPGTTRMENGSAAVISPAEFPRGGGTVLGSDQWTFRSEQTSHCPQDHQVTWQVNSTRVLSAGNGIVKCLEAYASNNTGYAGDPQYPIFNEKGVLVSHDRTGTDY